VEVEVKYEVLDRDRLLDRLAGLGIILTDPVLQEDQAYAPAEWSYDMSKIGVSFARLRTEYGAHRFTVKQPLTDEQTCVEHECHVSDRAEMHHALVTMGWRPTVQIVKQRRTARWGEYSVCLDDVHGLGTFLEIEALVVDDVDRTRHRLHELAAELAVLGERVDRTYDSLVRELSVL